MKITIRGDEIWFGGDHVATMVSSCMSTVADEFREILNANCDVRYLAELRGEEYIDILDSIKDKMEEMLSLLKVPGRKR